MTRRDVGIVAVAFGLLVGLPAAARAQQPVTITNGTTPVDVTATGAMNTQLEGTAIDTTADAVKGVLVDSAGVPLAFGQDAVIDAPSVSGGPQGVLDAETLLSTRTLVADGDAARAVSGVDGVQITRPHTGLEDIVDGVNTNTDGTSTSLIVTSGTGIKTYLTSITCINTSTTGIYVELKSGTVVKYRLPVPAAGVSDVNGVTKDFVVPLKPNAANEAWNTDGSAAVATLLCSGIGFRSAL